MNIPRPVAFITGASSGIGRSVAEELSRTHSIIAVDITTEGIVDLQTQIVATGGRCEAYQVDITDLDALNTAVRDGEKELGKITATVACAGIDVRGTALTTDPAAWAKCLSVNLTGVFLTAKSALPSLIETRGTFTAISSDAGTSGSQGYAPYIASKHGVIGLVRSMAMDFGPSGVRSNVVCPGFVETPMAARLFADSSPGEVDFFRKSVPLGRFALPQEIAHTVRHFVEAPYANGTVYALDGGSTAGYFIPEEQLSLS